MQMPPNMGESFAKEFREIYPELSKSLKTALIPFLLENVGGIAELNQPDQIHPTAKGHEIVATNVWKTLEPVLLELTAPAPAP
jgi:acyl-CoA thioesterase-1